MDTQPPCLSTIHGQRGSVSPGSVVERPSGSRKIGTVRFHRASPTLTRSQMSVLLLQAWEPGQDVSQWATKIARIPTCISGSGVSSPSHEVGRSRFQCTKGREPCIMAEAVCSVTLWIGIFGCYLLGNRWSRRSRLTANSSQPFGGALEGRCAFASDSHKSRNTVAGNNFSSTSNNLTHSKDPSRRFRARRPALRRERDRVHTRYT